VELQWCSSFVENSWQTPVARLVSISSDLVWLPYQIIGADDGNGVLLTESWMLHLYGSCCWLKCHIYSMFGLKGHSVKLDDSGSDHNTNTKLLMSSMPRLKEMRYLRMPWLTWSLQMLQKFRWSTQSTWSSSFVVRSACAKKIQMKFPSKDVLQYMCLKDCSW
jgi:hypothetical protein